MSWLIRRQIRRMTDDWDYIDKPADAAEEHTAAPYSFAHTLALKQGVLHVQAMLCGLSCSQFDDWYQFYRKNPWGYQIENFRAGQLCAVIANSSGRFKKPRNASDFYPNLS